MSITPKDPADFTPSMGAYKTLQPFRYWCQKVLPLVYDDSLSYYELLCKVVDYLNKTMEDVETLHGDVDDLHDAYVQLQTYVNNYFSTLDVQQEINNKLDVMASDGTLDALLLPYFNEYKNEINGIIAGQNQIITTQNEKIGVLEGRMDEFASLPDGSTSGDAELVDIRVAENGEIYSSAGNAVRGQVGKLKKHLEEANLGFETYDDYKFTQGVWSSSGINTNVKYRVAIKQITTADRTVTLVANTGFMFAIHEYSGGVFVRDLGYHTEYQLNKDFEYTMFIRRSTEDTTEEASVSEFVNQITWKNVTMETAESIEDLTWANYPLDFPNKSGWYRYSNGEFTLSAATTSYLIKNKRSYKKIRCFTKSDNRTIAAIAFFNSDVVSTNSYMYDASVPWGGGYPDGKWYEANIPEDAVYIAISVANNTSTYSSCIRIQCENILEIAEDNFLNVPTFQTTLREENDKILYNESKYIYHWYMAQVSDRSIEPVIPSESIFDVRNAHNYGYNYIEANVHKTSDNKYVVTHGLNNALGHDFDDLNGNDAYGVVIAEHTLSDLRTNYRYRSSVPDYRVPITTLEEFLMEAKKYNMTVMVQYRDAAQIEIIKGIMGNRFFLYNATRSVYDGPILWYGSLTSKEAILARCEEYGRPFIYSMGNPQYFSDDVLQDIINTLHNKGYYIATAYISGSALEKYSKMGFDLFAVDRGYFDDSIILNGHRLIFNNDGTITWVSAEV